MRGASLEISSVLHVSGGLGLGGGSRSVMG